MGSISTEGTPVALRSGSAANPSTFPISTSGHLLLVYRDDDGNEFVIRGGPTNGGDPFGNLIVEINEPIETSIDRRVVAQDGVLVPVTAEFRGNTEIDFGDRNPDKIWEILKQHAENIHSEGLTYNPLGNNSNGTVGNLLAVVGIDIDDVLPNPSGVMLVPFSGKGEEFSFDYTLNGADDDDVLIGGGGNQTFSGGDGDDELSGGEGSDNLTGGEGQDTFFGTPEDLNGDTITDLEFGDRIGTSGATVDPETIGSTDSTVFFNADSGLLDLFGTDVAINAILPVGATLNLLTETLDDGGSILEVVGGDPIELKIEEQLGINVDEFQRNGADAALGLFDTLPFVSGDLSDGFFLSSGAFPGSSNTSGSFTVGHGTPGDADLSAVAASAFGGAGATQDAATIEFEVNIDDLDVDGISFDLVFGSEEYPEFSNSSFVDVAAVFVNGTNVALFNNDASTPLSVIDANVNSSNFIDNQGGAFPTELDGFSEVLTIRAPLQAGENQIKIGIADTGDSSLDSAIFLSNLSFLKGGAIVDGVLTVVDDGEGDDLLSANSFAEEFNLSEGADIVSGTPENLDGDVITGFGSDDNILLLATSFGADDLQVTFGSAILDIDTDQDGTSDTTITLEGDFEGAKFNVENVDGNTEINVVLPSAAPVASAGAAGGDEDSVISGMLSASDIDSETLTYALAADGGASNGAVSVGADGSFTYTPNADFNGSDSFTYEVSDGTSTDTAEVALTVNPVDDAPVASAGAAGGDEDSVISGMLSASDIDSETLTYALAADGGASNGGVSVGADGSFTYTPNADFNGSDSFTYEVSDGTSTDTAEVALTVNPVDDAPVASAGAAGGDEDSVISGMLSASDIDSETLTYALAADGGASNGAVSVGADGSFTYTPNADFNGSDSFTYEVSDGTSTDTAEVALTVNPVDDAPVASAGAAGGDEDSVISGMLSASDIDSETLTYALAADGGASNGGVSVGADGSFTYTPNTDFNGSDSFTYEVSDGTSTDTAEVALTVNPVDDAPVASAGAAGGDEDSVISGMLSASDIDSETLTYALAADGGASNGGVSVGADGSFTYTPNADFNGSDSFTYEVSDGTSTDTAEVALTVIPVDEPATQGDDILIGTELNDTISALGGNDTVTGLQGDDLLRGGGGDDNIRGSGGDDRLRGNGGDDTLKGNGGSDNIKGGGGVDNIKGNGGADVIKGGGGADTVKGGGGSDTIDGGGGADRLEGGGGADVLTGKGGDDTLKGNGGADTFRFRASDRNDTILDFRQGQDKIEIQNGARSFDGLTFEQDGADVLIGFGSGQVRVVTDNIGAFDEGDFIF